MIEELDRETTAHTQLLVQPSPTQQQQTDKVNKVSGATEGTEEALLLDASVTEGTAEVTPEEDKLLGAGDVTVTVTATVVGHPKK